MTVLKRGNTLWYVVRYSESEHKFIVEEHYGYDNFWEEREYWGGNAEYVSSRKDVAEFKCYEFNNKV